MLISRSVLLVLSWCVCVSVCVENADAPAPRTATERRGDSSSLTETFQSPNGQRDAFKQEQEDDEEPRSSHRDEIKGNVSESTTSALSLQQSSINSNLSLKTNTTIDPSDIPKSLSFREVPNGTVRLSRRRRSWIWNQFFVIEEYSGPEPVLLGRLRSSVDRGDGRVLYVLSGEGAGSVFVIDGRTGNIHVTKPLDREQKDQYKLVATATDQRTGRVLEASSQFTIRVQDINDNPPLFKHTHYIASVPERASAGTSVIQVTATDADDQSYGNSAKLVYSIIQGQQYFTVDPQSGVVRTAVSDMDREQQSQYIVVLEARDMAGHQGGLTGTTTITVHLSDVNDSPPRFTQRVWTFSVSELALPGAEVGRVSATDADVGENAKLEFSITDGEGGQIFNITGLNQEGVIILNKALDFETRSLYTLPVEVQNPNVDMRFLRGGVFKDEAVVRITVLNADEPPLFTRNHYTLNITENCRVPCSVGRVHAVDPDTGHGTNIEYSIAPGSDPGAVFRISPVSGLITAVKVLDREHEQWHNITVTATQRDSPNQVTRVVVAIETLDVNDNPPELDGPYETAVCDTSTAGQVVQVIRAIDRDEISSGSAVHFSVSAHSRLSLNFTTRTRGNHTANLLLLSSLKPLPRPVSSHLHIVKVPIILRDRASELSSTGTVTVTLCPCQNGGMWVEERRRGMDGGRSGDGEVLMEWEKVMVCSSLPTSSMLLGFSSAAMLAILACSSVLMVVVLSLSLRRKRSDSLSPVENDEIRENIITYDDEGGGEEDTAAFDITALKSIPHAIHTRGVGSVPLYSHLCYSIHTASSSPFGGCESRLDKPAHTLPSGYTLNIGLLEPGSTLTEPAEECKSSDQDRTEDSADIVLKKNQAGSDVITQDQDPLVLNDLADHPVASQTAHLHSSVSSSVAPDDITPPHSTGNGTAPFRTMEGTLLRPDGGIHLTRTPFLYLNPGQDYVQQLVGLHLGGRSFFRPDLGGVAVPLTLRIDELLQHRLTRVTFDPMQPPYDSLQMYEHEGSEAETASLSSLESEGDGGMEGEGLIDLGPKFNKLLEIFREREQEKDGGKKEEKTEERHTHGEQQKSVEEVDGKREIQTELDSRKDRENKE
ncbi:cadherin-24 isoform X2 [Hemibagrus wyckioides]|uniref:cadherin-24 isoform X2 n=1 Tax=Hemibagrus wyckioides TaxID=337641 RepID=UPI00266DC80A|nr:cadherin-24 isoform X2 [Hemibagrus wyckioides]